MKARAWYLVGSLLANGALAVAVWRSPSAPLPAGNEASASSQAVSPALPAPTVPPASALPTVAPRPLPAAPPPFHWSAVESADYQEYIARLRALGCPEKVIRDIIIAEIDKLYAPRFAALRPPKPEPKKYWERNYGWSDSTTSKEQREQSRALSKEKQDLLEALLGKDFRKQQSLEAGVPDRTSQLFGSLSGEKLDRATKMFEAYNEAKQKVYRQANGYIDQETQGELKLVEKRFREQLATVLTPEQLENFELRTSDISQQLRHELQYFAGSEEEFRSIFRFKQAESDLQAGRPRAKDGVQPTAEEWKKYREQEQQAKEALTAALGPERAKEYELQQDWTFRGLLEMGADRQSLTKVAELKQSAEAAVSKLRTGKFNDEQSKEALAAIRAETEKELTSVLGERRANYYRSSSGSWVRNLAPTPIRQ